jgi:hypothetical protein
MKRQIFCLASKHKSALLHTEDMHALRKDHYSGPNLPDDIRSASSVGCLLALASTPYYLLRPLVDNHNTMSTHPSQLENVRVEGQDHKYGSSLGE